MITLIILKIKKIEKETSKKQLNLLILHLPPPIHGASMVGEFILKNKRINDELNNHFVK